MRMRLLALALLAAAAAIHVLVTLPAQRQAAADGAEYRRVREQRRLVQARLARLERAEQLRRQAAAVFAAPAPEETVRLARRSLIASLDGLPLSNVRISVRPGRDDVAAVVTLTAEGGFDEVVQFSGHVVRPGSGLVLQTVAFTTRQRVVSLTVDAVGPADS